MSPEPVSTPRTPDQGGTPTPGAPKLKLTDPKSPLSTLTNQEPQLIVFSRGDSDYPWSFKVLCGIVIFLALFPQCFLGEQCGLCEPRNCEPPPQCGGSLVADGCGCCQVCAKLLHEVCGGLYGRLGECDTGLQCTVSPLPGQPPDGALNGTCTVIAAPPPESLCDKSKCVATGHVLTCPNDTSLVYDTLTAGSCCPPSSSCQCLPCHPDLHCDVTEVKVILQRGTGLPGYCCDVYTCRDKGEVCVNVTCPVEEGITCPSDSESLPPLVTHGGCCSSSTGCKCKDQTSCDVLTCPPGQRVQVVLPSTGEPGNCCDQLKCVSDLGLTCSYEGLEYEDGESWSPKHCTSCTCRSSLVFCSSMKCDSIHLRNCGWQGLEDETHCCPVCKGCISSNGSRYANGETWERDECTTCRCEAGMTHCQASMCSINCAHPRKDPARCCPVCDDVLIVTQAPHCVPPMNCSLQCPQGWMKDDQGCYICQCVPEPEETCTLTCPVGYRYDEAGRQLCECETEMYTTRQPTCQPLRRCKKQCAHGFKKNKYGCERCRCKKCPPFYCKKKCIHGYAYSNEGNTSNQGCKLCKCKDAASLPPSETTLYPPLVSECMSVHGRRMEDGESWYDGCRRCFCHDGFEWCSLMTCPVLPCRHPVMRPADCCPSCPEDDPTSLVPGAPTRCQASGGQYRTEGETWQLDTCTRCICHAGGVLCQIESCPPLLCHHPIMLPGVCCPSCPDEGGDFFQYKPIVLHSSRSCTTDTGTKFTDGDSWRANACQSCVCRRGQIHCFSQTCPLLTCNYTLLKKGQCCPFCVEEHSVSSCQHGGETYVTGEGWLIENCRQCMCDHGHVVCSQLECPPPRCRFPIKHPGICCPMCTNDTVEVTVSSPSGHLPPALPPNQTKAPPGTGDEVDDVPQVEGRFRTFGITVGILATIVVILLLLIVVLLILLRRTRRKSGIALAASPKVTEVMMPKSTNLELQGLPPISNGHAPLINGHPPLTNGNLYKNHGEKFTSPVMLRNGNMMTAEEMAEKEKEKESNLKELYRYSCAEGVLKHELAIPTDPNDFRKSV